MVVIDFHDVSSLLSIVDYVHEMDFILGNIFATAIDDCDFNVHILMENQEKEGQQRRISLNYPYYLLVQLIDLEDFSLFMDIYIVMFIIYRYLNLILNHVLSIITTVFNLFI